jgi:hypothetical protein
MGSKDKKRKQRASSSTSSTDLSFEKSSVHSPRPETMADSKKSRTDKTKGQTTMSDFTMTASARACDSGETTVNEKLDVVLSQMLTTQDLKKALQEIKDDILKEVNLTIQTTFEEMNGRLHDLSVENETLNKKVWALTRKNSDLEVGVKAAKNDAKITAQKTNDLEQHTRKSSIRIFGLPDNKKDESIYQTADVVTQLLTEKLQMKISPFDIDIAHRLGRFEAGRPRPIIAKFMTRRHKIEAVQKRRSLKGTRIVIREDLTPMNQALLKDTSDLERVDNAWSSDGKIYAKLISGSIVRVTHVTDLEKL